ncbi:MAG: lipopolysaccharide biosynthesis protein, partial [Cyclobacteriaceae bacterium]
LFGFGLFLLIFIFIKDWIIAQADEDSLLGEYVNLIIPFTFFWLLFLMLDIYNRALFNASTGTLLNETVARILVLILLILFVLDLFSFESYVDFYVLSRGLLVLMLILFLAWKKDISLKPDFSLLDKGMRKDMLSLSFYSLLTGFSTIAVMRIDAIMISNFLSEADVGIYLTTFYFGTLVSLPSRALRGITPTFVADAFKENDLESVAEIYRKSTVTQMVAGAYLMIGIWANIHNVFEILPEEFRAGMYVILYIGLMNMVKMLSGINDVVIGYSKYYRFNTYSMLGWLGLIVLSNWWLVPLMGISGAALASFLSVIAVDLVRMLFIYYRFGFQPYGKPHLIILFISVATYLLSLLLPDLENFMLDILIRGSLITLLFVPAIYFSRTAPEINRLLDSYLRKLPFFNKEN